MIVGCYTLHLYCDFNADHAPGEQCYMGEFTGHSMTASYKEARHAGWRVYPAQQKAKCPACVKRGKK